MPSRNRRRRPMRFALPRQARLALSIAVLVLIILGVVLLVRGCQGKGDPAPADQTVIATPAPELTPTPAPELTPPPEPEFTPQPQRSGEALPFGDRSAVIRSIGDIVAHNPLLKGAYVAADKSYNFSPYLSQIKASMEAADYTVLNVDGPMGGKKFASYRGYPQFNTPPHLLYALADCGVDMLTLANNHALDTYFDGLKATIDNVESVGMDHVGTYRTQQEHDTPKVVAINGIMVGITNYTVDTNNMAKRSDPEASVYGLRMVSNSDAPADIKALRDAGAEVVIVYMHWGEEYLRQVNNGIKNLATRLVAAGADVVIGGHQHVVLPCQYVTTQDAQGQTRTGLVMYGMGNFLSDQRERYKDSGVIFEITLKDNPQSGKVEVVSPRYVPTYVQRTKGATAYDYRVWPVGAVLDKPPSSIPADVLKRMKEVWQEQEQIFSGGPATPAKK